MPKQKKAREAEAAVKAAIRHLVKHNTKLVIDELLDHHFWLQSLETSVSYQRLGDDTDGSFSCIEVGFSPDMDGRVGIFSQLDTNATSYSLYHRFRTYMGGGMSPRTRTALLILARAIQRDNEDRPQRTPEKKL